MLNRDGQSVGADLRDLDVHDGLRPVAGRLVPCASGAYVQAPSPGNEILQVEAPVRGSRHPGAEGIRGSLAHRDLGLPEPEAGEDHVFGAVAFERDDEPGLGTHRSKVDRERPCLPGIRRREALLEGLVGHVRAQLRFDRDRVVAPRGDEDGGATVLVEVEPRGSPRDVVGGFAELGCHSRIGDAHANGVEGAVRSYVDLQPGEAQVDLDPVLRRHDRAYGRARGLRVRVKRGRTPHPQLVT